MIPTKVFFTRGIGHGNEKIVSFENALREAKISCYNLVTVSSILPANCEEISVEDGIQLLSPGQIVYTVLSRRTHNNFSENGSDNVFASIGIAKPNDQTLYGYLGEYSGMNKSLEFVKKESCELAKNLLVYSRDNGEIACNTYEVTSYTKLKSKIKSDYEYTTCIAAAVFIE